jgi:hypothetical protein
MSGVELWRARAWARRSEPCEATGRWAGTEFFGFGGPDTHEVIGTAEEVAGEVAGLLNSLELPEVLAHQQEQPWFGVVVEVEPSEGPVPQAEGRELDPRAERRVPAWEVDASVGNGHGVFDAAYSYGNTHGDEAHLVGTGEEVAAELAVLLRGLGRDDVETMKYGTRRFFVELVITPYLRRAESEQEG